LEESRIPELPSVETIEELYQIRLGFFAPNNEWHAQVHSVPDNKTISLGSHNLGLLLSNVRKILLKHQAEVDRVLEEDQPRIIIPNGSNGA
jgi:hypothetical protein